MLGPAGGPNAVTFTTSAQYDCLNCSTVRSRICLSELADSWIRFCQLASITLMSNICVQVSRWFDSEHHQRAWRHSSSVHSWRVPRGSGQDTLVCRLSCDG